MASSQQIQKNSGSFRDPSGFLFYRDGLIHRQVNDVYRENYRQLLSSGLYDALARDELLIPHEEVDRNCAYSEQAYKIILPEQIPFISYPYEWCFSQLKDAALTTLQIQKRSLGFGMSLKDCSAYNVQFRNGRPILIDTLSFEGYREERPWVAYRQFCQHFLAPLALMRYTDVRLSQLLRIHLDGIPLDVTSRLLPWHTCSRFGLLSHLHLHSKCQRHFADKSTQTTQRKMNRTNMLGLIDSLETTVKKLTWKSKESTWDDYYDKMNYSTEAFREKIQFVTDSIAKIQPKSVWDLGANTGLFSRIASANGIQTISFDNDPTCVEKNYCDVVSKKERNILPLLVDLTNPSPALGWQNLERQSLLERGPTDTVLALALLHHFVISNNVPLGDVARFLAKICRSLIIEFIPKSDCQVQRLLTSREDIFPDYTQQMFEENFTKYFAIENAFSPKDTQRCLYLMVRQTTNL